MKEWGGWTDDISMNVFGLFILFYSLFRLIPIPIDWEFLGLRVDKLLFWIAYILLNVILAAIIWAAPSAGTILFVIIIVIALGLEWVIYFRAVFSPSSGRISGPHLWFWLANGIFVLAVVIWLTSGTGSYFCKKVDIKGHAWWHILCGVAAYLLFIYYRKQERQL